MKVLSLGERLEYTTSWSDWDGDYNIRDFDVVFYNFERLERLVRNSSTNEVFNDFGLPGDRIVWEHLSSDNNIVVILPENTSIPRNRSLETSLFNWPPELDIRKESGETILSESIKQKWSWYFNGGDFQFDLVLQDVSNTKGENYEFRIDPIVVNNWNRPVAWKASLYLPQKGRCGSVYYVPLLKDWSYDDLVQGIVRRIFQGKAETIESSEAPDWTDEYPIPGEQSHADRIGDLVEQITELEDELSHEESMLSERQRFKSLLYGNEDVLEEIVPEALREIGLEVEGEQPHAEDGTILLPDKKVILEVTGTSGGISKGKARELDNWVSDQMMENSDDEITGMLIVNPKRRQNPSERNMDGLVSPDTVGYMKRRGYKILPTTELYKLFVGTKEGALDQSNLIAKMDSDETLIEFDQ